LLVITYQYIKKDLIYIYSKKNTYRKTKKTTNNISFILVKGCIKVCSHISGNHKKGLIIKIFKIEIINELKIFCSKCALLTE